MPGPDAFNTSTQPNPTHLSTTPTITTNTDPDAADRGNAEAGLDPNPDPDKQVEVKAFSDPLPGFKDAGVARDYAAKRQQLQAEAESPDPHTQDLGARVVQLELTLRHLKATSEGGEKRALMLRALEGVEASLREKLEKSFAGTDALLSKATESYAATQAQLTAVAEALAAELKAKEATKSEMDGAKQELRALDERFVLLASKNAAAQALLEATATHSKQAQDRVEAIGALVTTHASDTLGRVTLVEAKYSSLRSDAEQARAEATQLTARMAQVLPILIHARAVSQGRYQHLHPAQASAALAKRIGLVGAQVVRLEKQIRAEALEAKQAAELQEGLARVHARAIAAVRALAGAKHVQAAEGRAQLWREVRRCQADFAALASGELSAASYLSTPYMATPPRLASPTSPIAFGRSPDVARDDPMLPKALGSYSDSLPPPALSLRRPPARPASRDANSNIAQSNYHSSSGEARAGQGSFSHLRPPSPVSPPRVISARNFAALGSCTSTPSHTPGQHRTGLEVGLPNPSPNPRPRTGNSGISSGDKFYGSSSGTSRISPRPPSQARARGEVGSPGGSARANDPVSYGNNPNKSSAVSDARADRQLGWAEARGLGGHNSKVLKV